MHHNHIHCEDTTQSLLIYTEQQQRLCACAATHIHHIHIHCEDTTQLLRIYRLAWCSKSIDFSHFKIDLHTSQSYTEQWQRLNQHWAHTRHSHIHYEGTIQLLRIYMLARCSKSIDFSHYQIDLHALQSYKLQRHDTVFAHIHRMTATSLCMCCNSYTSHIYTLQRHDSAFAHLHACKMQ